MSADRLAEIKARAEAATPEDVPWLVKQVERLEAWKTEALPVMEGLQQLGDALGLRIGEQITGTAGLDAALALRARAKSAEAEVSTLRARLAEAEALHWKVGGACSHCSQRSDYAVAWPCETAVALAGTTGEGE